MSFIRKKTEPKSTLKESGGSASTSDRDDGLPAKLAELEAEREQLQRKLSALEEENQEMQEGWQKLGVRESRARQTIRKLEEELESERKATAEARKELAECQRTQRNEARRREGEMLQLSNEAARLRALCDKRSGDSNKLYYLFQLVALRSEKEKLLKQVASLKADLVEARAAAASEATSSSTNAADAAGDKLGGVEDGVRTDDGCESSTASPPALPLDCSLDRSAAAAFDGGVSGSTGGGAGGGGGGGGERGGGVAPPSDRVVAPETVRVYQDQMKELNNQLELLQVVVEEKEHALELVQKQRETAERERDAAEKEKAVLQEKLEELWEVKAREEEDATSNLMELSPDDARAQLMEAQDKLERERNLARALGKELFELKLKMRSLGGLTTNDRAKAMEVEELKSRAERAEGQLTEYMEGVQALKKDILRRLTQGQQEESGSVSEGELLAVILHLHLELEGCRRETTQLQEKLMQSSLHVELNKLEIELEEARGELKRTQEALVRERQLTQDLREQLDECESSFQQLQQQQQQKHDEAKEQEEQHDDAASVLSSPSSTTTAATATVVDALRSRLAESRHRAEEAEKRRVEAESKLKEQEQAFASRLQRQIAETEHSARRAQAHLVEELRGELRKLQGEVQKRDEDQKKHAGAERRIQELETQLDEIVAEIEKIGKEQQQSQERIRRELEEERLTNQKLQQSLTEARSVQSFPEKVEVTDPRKRGHVLRLRTKSSYTCAACLQVGKGVVWKCSNMGACNDYIHPECMVDKSLASSAANVAGGRKR